MKKQVTISAVNEQIVVELSKKDLQAFQEQKKSYELLNWLKDELVIRQDRKMNQFQISNKALSRCISVLGFLRQNMTRLDIKILDNKDSLVSYEYDLTTLTNGQIRRYNQEFNCNIEEHTEDEKDQTYDHLI